MKKVANWVISNIVKIIVGVAVTLIGGSVLLRMENVPGFPFGIADTVTPTGNFKTSTIDTTQIPTVTEEHIEDNEDILLQEVNKLADGEWEILISEDFTIEPLGPEWRKLYNCEYGQFYIDQGRLNLNISTEDKVSLGECVIYPSSSALTNKGQLKIFIEYFIENSTISNGWLGFFAGCMEENIQWLSITANQQRINAQTLEEDYLIASNLEDKKHIIVIDYNNGYVKWSLIESSNDELIKCTIPLSSIRFGAGVRENGGITGWINRIVILTK